MSATFTWSIQQMSVRPQEGSYTDVVISASWSCLGQETQDAKRYSGNISAATSFPMPEGTFTPYDQLTQDQVLGWIWANGVNKAAVEAGVQQQIDDQINPPVITPPLPWAPPAA